MTGVWSWNDGGVRMLMVSYPSFDEFKREFEENIANGGIFVETNERAEMRSTVQVGIELAYCKESVVLDGEVVHCVSQELASAGAVPGVAIQFVLGIARLREILEPFLDEERFTGPAIASASDASDASLAASQPADVIPHDDRRDSRRQRARVHARIRTTSGDELEGLTRDVSASGMLFSVASDAPNVGEAVWITLRNAVTGESLEVSGVVARQIKCEAGDIPAIGVRFDHPLSSREESRGFLDRLQAAEHSRRLGGISGDISELALADMLQSFGQGSGEGTISLMHGPLEGHIAFCDGMLVAASVGRVRGSKALVRLLSWDQGSFEFQAHVDPGLRRDDPVHLEHALLEALRQVDENRRSEVPNFPAVTLFEVAPSAISEIGDESEKLDSAILDLLGVGANVRRLLDIIPESDARIHEALAALVERGVLRPMAP
jgi:Tfp pilus assembly protein PilZ